MTDSLPRFVVFDHDQQQLQKIAVECKLGFAPLLVTEVGNQKDLQAVNLLLADTKWMVALVHINPVPWNTLWRQASADQVLVRFSTEGYPPGRPESAKALCLQCTKSINVLRKEDIGALAKVLTDAESLAGLRAGLIPPSIRHLIAFESPHRIRALHIMLQGVLATWASDPVDERSAQAKSCLGDVSIPPLPSRDIDKRFTLWQALGLGTQGEMMPECARDLSDGIARELGVKDLRDELRIRGLLDLICSGDAAASPDATVVIEGFQALDRFLEVFLVMPWSRAKSDFNHAWLKNRLTVSLSKARKVLEGEVQDDAIWDDMPKLLGEWPARKADALRVLEAYPEAVSPRRDVEGGIRDKIDSETSTWLGEIAYLRWSAAEQPEVRLSETRKALTALDTQIEIVTLLLPDARREESLENLTKALVELQSAASSLGKAFSALGSHRA